MDAKKWNWSDKNSNKLEPWRWWDVSGSSINILVHHHHFSLIWEPSVNFAAYHVYALRVAAICYRPLSVCLKAQCQCHGICTSSRGQTQDASLWPLAEWISSFLNKYCRPLWSVRRQQWHRVVSRPYLSEYFDKCSIKIVIIQLISEVWMWLSRQPWLSEWVYLSEPISALECSSKMGLADIPAGSTLSRNEAIDQKKWVIPFRENILLKRASIILSGNGDIIAFKMCEAVLLFSPNVKSFNKS